MGLSSTPVISACTIEVRREQVAAAADADDRSFANARKIISQVDHVVAEEFDGPQRPIVVVHHCTGGTIDVQRGLLDAQIRRHLR